MLKGKVLEERDPDLNGEENIIIEDSSQEHWRDVAEDGEHNSNIYYLRWYVYTRDKEEFIKREFWCPFRIQKGGGLFGLVPRIISSRKRSNMNLFDYVGLIIKIFQWIEWGYSIGITQVSLSQATNSFVAWVLIEAYENINIEVGESFLDNCGGVETASLSFQKARVP